MVLTLDQSGGICSQILGGSQKRLLAGLLITIGVYLYTLLYDMPGSLQLEIQNIFNIEPYQFEYLYSFYAVPNIIICFTNGILLDRYIDLKSGASIFAAILVIGQTVQLIGGIYGKYWLTVLGRVIYGSGAESIIIILTSYLTFWFVGKQLNTMNSVYACSIRLASSTVFAFTLPLYKLLNNSFSLILTISLLTSVLMSSVIISLTYYSKQEVKSNIGSPSLKDIIKLPTIHWLNVTVISLSTTTVVSFVSVSQQYLILKYQINVDEANRQVSFFNLIGGFSPILPGILADLTGYNLYIILTGVLSGLVAHFLFLFSPINPYIPSFLFALSFGVVNTVNWSVIGLSVEPYQISTGLGIAFCLIHLTNTFFPIIVGYLLSLGSLEFISILFISLYTVSLVCVIFMIILDKHNGEHLNKKVKQQQTTTESN